MPDITKDAVLSDVLSEYDELIPIVNRFGINLGVGDFTLDELCNKHSLNISFILTVLNVYIDDKYLPKGKLSTFNIELIAGYFEQTIKHYMQSLVPNIEKHLNAFITISGSESEELKMIQQLFLQFKNELTEHLEKGLNHTVDYPHELLHDLKSFFIKHISQQFNQNLCYAVIFSINSLEKDLIIHNRLRHKILIPKLNELNISDIKMLQHSLADENKDSNEKKRSLTKREIEILKLITQGFINKEIADKLNISLNTVLTHRKNIIFKTGIKTVSGLTFYAILNGYLTTGYTID